MAIGHPKNESGVHIMRKLPEMSEIIIKAGRALESVYEAIQSLPAGTPEDNPTLASLESAKKELKEILGRS